MLISVSVPVVAIADQQDVQQDRAPTNRAIATATMANMLPVDGCSYPVTINGTDYAPDEASLEQWADLVPGGSTVTMRIRYRLTGETAIVNCGFGFTRELPEISFRVLRVIEDDSSVTTDTSPR